MPATARVGWVLTLGLGRASAELLEHPGRCSPASPNLSLNSPPPPV